MTDTDFSVIGNRTGDTERLKSETYFFGSFGCVFFLCKCFKNQSISDDFPLLCAAAYSILLVSY